MLYEDSIKSRHTPHIITGSRAQLQAMFFQETSLGNYLELVNLSGFDNAASLKLFTSLCEGYNITIDKDLLLGFNDLFKGNPFYIKSFIQAARLEGKTLSENDLWTVYFNEITGGKFYTYWVSKLRIYMPRINLRKTSLEFLYHFCKPGAMESLTKYRDDEPYQQDSPPVPSGSEKSRADITSMPSISAEDFNDMINAFQAAGIIEINFSTYKLTDDEVLADVIKGLYSKETLEEPLSTIEEAFIKDRSKYLKTVGTPSFEVTIPIIPRAELIAVKVLEQIAKEQNIPTGVTGQLQVALIDLFANIQDNQPRVGNIWLKFEPGEDTFLIEIKTPYKELVSPIYSESIRENQLMKRYLDDIKVEKTKSGTKITLIKNLKLSKASNSTD